MPPARCTIAVGACLLGACHLLLPYEHRDDGGAGARDRSSDGAAVDRQLVLVDGAPTDAWKDGKPRILDAGAACVNDVALWIASCRRAQHPNSCGIGCGAYTVVCIGNACTCALTDGDSHPCTGVTVTEATCEPTSSCFQAVSAGCCADL